jgi:hypothetical protein
MKCGCGQDISDERVEFLKSTGRAITCITCSREQPKVSFMSYTHKTAGEIVVVPNNPDGTRNKELIRIAERAFRRSR